MSALVDAGPAPPAATRALAWWILGGLAALGAFLLIGQVQPLTSGFVVCAFRRLTGTPCPGCGLTRATAALARGELLAALRLHLFAPLLLLQAVWLWCAGTWSLLRRGELALPSPLLVRLLAWNGAAMLAFWLARLATGTLPG